MVVVVVGVVDTETDIENKTVFKITKTSPCNIQRFFQHLKLKIENFIGKNDTFNKLFPLILIVCARENCLGE